MASPSESEEQRRDRIRAEARSLARAAAAAGDENKSLEEYVKIVERREGAHILEQARAAAKTRESERLGPQKAKPWAPGGQKAPTNTPPEHIGDTLEFREQCFLSDHLPEYAAQAAAQKDKHKLITRLGTDDPSTVLSKFNSRQHASYFIRSIRPYEIAALVPKIRLFKVFYDELDQEKKITELIFNDSTSKESLEKMTTSKYGRGDGVGIKAFKVKTQGRNPAEGALVACTLTLTFQDIGMLVDEDAPDHINYLHLITRRTKYTYERYRDGRVIPGTPRTLNKKYFKLMAVVGWATPPATMDLGPNTTILKKSLERCSQTIFLDMTDHSIDFRQDGTIELTIEYQGALQSIMNNPLLDVLYLKEDRENEKKLETIAARLSTSAHNLRETETHLETVNTVSSEDVPAGRRASRGSHRTTTASRATTEQEIKQLKAESKALTEQLATLKAKARAKRYSRILTALFTKKKIYHYDLSRAEISTMMYTAEARGRVDSPPLTRSQPGPSSGATVRTPGADELRTADLNRGEEGSTSGPKWNLVEGQDVPKADPSKHRINFFYFGDLIEEISSIFQELRNSQVMIPEIQMILGSFTYYDQKGHRVVVNLADVPISTNLFEIWFNRNVVRPLKDRYPMRAFIRDIVIELILPALGELCFAGVGKKTNLVGLQSLLVPKKSGGHAVRIKKGDVELGVDLKADVFSSFIPTQAPPRRLFSGYQHCLLIYGAAESPDDLNPSNEEADFQNGVYHFVLGADAGILKSVNFSKTDVQGLTEARFTSAETDRGQLRHKYDTTLDLVGNPFFTPGQKIYINPTLTGLGAAGSRREMAKELGLGGYYDVIEVTSTYNSRGYKTELKCTWTSFGKVTGRGDRKKKPRARPAP